MSEFIIAQSEARNNLIMQVRDVIETAETESRGLDQADTNKITAMEADIAKLDESIAFAKRSEERKVEASAAAKGFIPSVSAERSATEILRNIAETRGAHTFERRTLVSTDNTVPKSFYDEVYAIARLSGPLLETSEVINTTEGNQLTIPTLTAYSVATIKGQGAAIDASDPTFSSITLGAFKYSFLIQAANELVTDAGFDLGSYLANQAGQAMGFGVNAGLTTGTGTVEPTGIVTASGSGVTGGTGVAGLFTTDQLIDLAYSVDGAVRRLPGAAYMANSSTVGKIRKLKDGDGTYLYQIGQTGAAGGDTFAGFNVVENPHMADVGTNAKSVLFGDLNSYKVRMAGGLDVASSQEFAFGNDLTTWRFLMRVDGNLTHAAHVKSFKGAAS
jgi:HK97 family phage major capsid protein